MGLVIKALAEILEQSGFMGLTTGNVIMLVVACILLYLAIGKGFEPLLLVPSRRAACWSTCPLRYHGPGRLPAVPFTDRAESTRDHLHGHRRLTDFSLSATPDLPPGGRRAAGVSWPLRAMMIGFSVPGPLHQDNRRGRRASAIYTMKLAADLGAVAWPPTATCPWCR